MKIAPLMHAMADRPNIQASIADTGRHYEAGMSKVFFDDLGIPEPSVNLAVGSGTRLEQIDRIMERFDPIVREQKPDLVLVVGDVNSTIACARIAKRHGCMVAHVEAGLRSFDASMPEEVNRVATDEISDLLFVTEKSGMDNLARERVSGSAHFVGNVMIDTLIQQLDKARLVELSEQLGLALGEFWVGTFHRPSNVDDLEDLSNVVTIIEYVAEREHIVLPLHPRTRGSLERHGLLNRLQQNPRVRILEPLGYVDFISLVSRSSGVVTDSGGIQEETTFLEVPCITMRDNTERPVTVEVGTNVLAGTDPSRVMSAIDAVRDGMSTEYEIPELWDGFASQRIVRILERELS